MPEYARLDLTALIKCLNSAVQKTGSHTVGSGVILIFLDSSQAHLAPTRRHSGQVENLAGDEVMHCVLAPSEETSFGPWVSSDLRALQQASNVQKINVTHAVWAGPSPLTDLGLRAQEVWTRFRLTQKGTDCFRCEVTHVRVVKQWKTGRSRSELPCCLGSCFSLLAPSSQGSHCASTAQAATP